MNFNFDHKVLLAPLAGISNSIFRSINRRFGADMVFTEMVSADGLVRKSPKTRDYIQFDKEERPIGVQLFGTDPAVMAAAACIVEATVKPDVIDLNFGCPVRKVVRRNGGSAILKDLLLLEKIVKAVADAVRVPVMVKLRSGWANGEIVGLEAAKIAEAFGARAVTLHPRTQEQGFSGKADWDLIRKLKETVHVPVIGNGDLFKAEDALRMISETGCDAVMVARGALGNPWIFREIRAALRGETVKPPDSSERLAICLEHLEKMIRLFGLPKGLYDMRKHFGWYLKGLQGASEVRRKIFTADDPLVVRKILEDFFFHPAEKISVDDSLAARPLN